MKNRMHTALAAAATAALCVGGLAATSAPASAGGDRHGDHGDHGGYDVVIPLSQRASNELRDGANGIAAIGKADKWTDGGRVVLSFPVGNERRGSGSMALAGGIEYTGAGRNVTWTGLRVSEHGAVSAVLTGGDRFKVLRVAGKRDGHYRTGDHHGGLTLVLTEAGAGSLNNAADGAPFSAGDVFAGGNDCR